MGRFFASFEEAWEAFLVRQEPLEDFFGQFAEEDATITIWQAPPGRAALAEAAAVQRALSEVEGLRLTPAHWLHVSLGQGTREELDAVRERLTGFGSFEAAYGPVNCFHDAIVLEAHSDRFGLLARAISPELDLDRFLPHLSIAYVEGEPPAPAVRDALVQLRSRPRVVDQVTQIELCVVPVRRSELLEPWQLAGVVELA